jgi:hypothetical protein
LGEESLADFEERRTALERASDDHSGVGVAVGNIAVVSIGLGLWWEWRLMWLAGEPWARIRNLRSLHAP